MKIIADKHIPYLKGILEKYSGDVKYLAGKDFVHENIQDATILFVRTVARLDRETLANTDVKLICSATIGYDHIDTRYCDEHDIAWRNAPGCNSRAVQQYVMAALIQWSAHNASSLKGKTIGIVGVGNVGSAVAVACEVLGMKVLLYDPPRAETEENLDHFVDMRKIQEDSDFITFHTPLIKEGKHSTYHLGDSSFFCSLKKSPVIINTSRGSVVDTEALKAALRSGCVSGAIIDCWENEPVIDRQLLHMVDIATPHIAGYSSDGKANASRMALLSLCNFYGWDKSEISNICEDKPKNAVIDLNIFKEKSRLFEAILTTYDPLKDSSPLRGDPDKFKLLRDDYVYRREFRAYTIVNATKEEKKIFERLNFIVK